MKTYTIYKHTNKINNKVYIGQTINTIEERAGKDGRRYKDSPYFYAAITKYGWDGFFHEILEDQIPTQEEANKKESYYIALYDATNRDKGYNIMSGGQGLNSSSSGWNNPEYKARMRESFSKARKRDWSDANFRNKAEEALLKGIHELWNDPIRRQKRINDLTGSKNPNSKKVRNLETGIVFSTIKEAAQWAGLKAVSGIGQCCRGERKVSGKHPETGVPLHWEYVKGGD